MLMGHPQLAFAFGLSDFVPPPSDKSMEYLGKIFGSVGTALSGSGTSLIGDLFNIFNIAVLTLGSLVVSYTIIITTINTAQEGEVMGRKWSSVWIPLRAGVGMAFLLPTATGYSLIQIFMMNVVVYGVGAADQVWGQVMTAIKSGPGVFGSVSMDETQLKTSANALLNSMVCQQVFNNDPSCKTAIGDKPVIAYDKGNQLFVGVQGDPQYGNLCGGLTAGGAPSSTDPIAWQSANISAFYAAATLESNAASMIYATPVPPPSGSPDVIAATVNILKGVTGTIAPPSNPTDLAKAAGDGWIFAGSYYFVLTASSSNLNYPAPSSFAGNTTGVGTQCSTALNNYLARVPGYVSATTSSSGSGGSNSLQINAPSISQSGALALYNVIADAVRGLTFSILNSLTTNSDDPITSLRTVGSTIMTTTENIWFITMAVGFAILIVGCIMSGMQPLCWALGVMITVFVPALTIIISLLWGAGAAIGLYLPLVPYLVYSFTALGWMLLVIETIAAAPVVALGLVSPAVEHLGKASPAVLLITNVFLRPSLMVIGFIAAIKLVRAAIAMVNFGFEATVNASVGSIGIFGCIALICIYGGLVIAVVHECFSLIHVLPDKIIRWIGGGPERSGESIKAQVGEVKGASEKGAELGGGLMKSSAGAMEEKVQKQMKDGGGGGGMPGGGGKGGGGIDGIAM